MHAYRMSIVLMLAVLLAAPLHGLTVPSRSSAGPRAQRLHSGGAADARPSAGKIAGGALVIISLVIGMQKLTDSDEGNDGVARLYLAPALISVFRYAAHSPAFALAGSYPVTPSPPSLP